MVQAAIPRSFSNKTAGWASDGSRRTPTSPLTRCARWRPPRPSALCTSAACTGRVRWLSRRLVTGLRRPTRRRAAARSTPIGAPSTPPPKWARKPSSCTWGIRESRRARRRSSTRSVAMGEHALGTGVRLGVECRDGYFEIPSLDEFAQVLGACDGLPVGYWHDAGHGAKLDYLGFLEHEEFLRRYGAQIVGMHIHDTRAGRDHLAPGQGSTDFGMLGRYLRPDTIRTLELHRTVAAADISRALDLLEPLEVFGVREGILVEL